jgi:hypothetical protein
LATLPHDPVTAIDLSFGRPSTEMKAGCYYYYVVVVGGGLVDAEVF